MRTAATLEEAIRNGMDDRSLIRRTNDVESIKTHVRAFLESKFLEELGQASEVQVFTVRRLKASVLGSTS